MENEEFLGSLFKGGRGYLVLAFKTRQGGWREDTYAWPHQRRAALDAIAAGVDRGDNVFFCPALRNERERKERDGKHLSWLWADVDMEKVPESKRSTVEARIKKIATMVVESGTPGNKHVYVKVEKELSADEHYKYNTGLRDHLYADHKQADNSLLRPPGTMNRKTGRGRRVRVGTGHGKRVPTAVLDRVDAWQNVRVDRSGAMDWQVVDVGHCMKISAVRRMMRMQPDEAVGRYGGRYKAIGAAVREMYKHNLTPDEIHTLMDDFPPAVDKLEENPAFNLHASVDRVLGKIRVAALEHMAEGHDGSSEDDEGAFEEIQEDGGGWGDPIDVGAVLRGEFIKEDTPKLLAREDGHFLLYRGATHTAFGESGSGKSWLGILAAIAAIVAGETALYLDFEVDGVYAVQRFKLFLKQFGLTFEDVIDRLTVIKVNVGRKDAQDAINHHINQKYGVVVFDTMAAALDLDGLDENSNNDIKQWIAAMPKRFAQEGGSAVLTIDHVKKPDAKGDLSVPDAIGAIAKRNQIDVAYWVTTPKRPFTKGDIGETEIRLVKDRFDGIKADGACGTYDPARKSWPVGWLVLDATDRENYQISITTPRAATVDESAQKDLDNHPHPDIMAAVVDVMAGQKDWVWSVRKLIGPNPGYLTRGMRSKEKVGESLDALARLGCVEAVRTTNNRGNGWRYAGVPYDPPTGSVTGDSGDDEWGVDDSDYEEL